MGMGYDGLVMIASKRYLDVITMTMISMNVTRMDRVYLIAASQLVELVNRRDDTA